MIYDILENKIAEAGLGVAGVSLFRQFMPASVNVGVMTRVPLEGLKIDPNMPCYFNGRMQVIVRHTDPVDGAALARDVSKALEVMYPEDHIANLERGPATVSIFFPETLPIQFPRLESDGIEWSIHFKTSFSFDPL